MDIPDEHRKRVKHFDVPGHVHELTFSCYDRMPLLVSDTSKALLSHAIDAAMARCGFHLVGFVYMPEHVHLLVNPVHTESCVSSLLYAIKRPMAYRAKLEFQTREDPLLASMMVKERPGKWTFRFWQEGAGYDRNLTRVEAVRDALDYLHANPVRRKLCSEPAQWRWSSWRYFHDPAWVDACLPQVRGLTTQ